MLLLTLNSFGKLFCFSLWVITKGSAKVWNFGGATVLVIWKFPALFMIPLKYLGQYARISPEFMLKLMTSMLPLMSAALWLDPLFGFLFDVNVISMFFTMVRNDVRI